LDIFEFTGDQKAVFVVKALCLVKVVNGFQLGDYQEFVVVSPEVLVLREAAEFLVLLKIGQEIQAQF
jgi:hypothetical protein